jgi:hypothetical protein
MLQTLVEEVEAVAPGFTERKTPPVKVPVIKVPVTVEVAPITGTVLQQMLRGKKPSQRAQVAAGFVAGSSQLVVPTPAQAARLTKASTTSVRRALGRKPRSPSLAEMADFIGRYGVAETELLLGQIRAVAVGTAL